MTADIIARLEAAERGSRELDGEIAKLFGWAVYKYADKRRPEGFALAWFPPENVYGKKEPPEFTTSLDAIAALTAEKLPGTSRSSFASGVEGMPCRACIWFVDGPESSGNAKTEPLARCIALLRALERIER